MNITMAIALLVGWLVFPLASAADETVAVPVSPLRLRIVYPPEKMTLPAMERTYVFGSVFPPGALVTVNGVDTPMVRARTGAWLAMVPIRAGKFSITAKAALDDGTETSVIRWVTGAKGAGERPDRDDTEETRKVVELGDQAVHKPPAERALKPARIARIASDTVFLRSGPNVGDDQAGYELRLDKDVLVTLVAQVGNIYQVKLSDLEYVWIDEYAVKLLPKQTPVPESLVNAWTVRRADRSTLIHNPLQELLPYRVTIAPDGRSLSLKIYGGVSNTDWIHYASGDPWIRQARWSHPMQGVYQLDLDLRQPVWGYDIRYEKKRLVLELRDPPPAPAPIPEPVTPRRKRERQPIVNQFENIKICLDPGHPPLGATGPLGIAEHVVNWQLAEKLRYLLTDLGAQVVMTREDGETTPLPDRVIRSRRADADLFISIHTNALPPSENPFDRNGFSIFYYQPFSQPLAEAMHSVLREQIPLRDDGLHYGNYHVIRQTFVPSILVECGYLIWPPEEELLMDADFQSQYAHALASGIEMFLLKRRSGL